MRHDDEQRVLQKLGEGTPLISALGVLAPALQDLRELLEEAIGQGDAPGIPWLRADSTAVKVLVSDFTLAAVTAFPTT